MMKIREALPADAPAIGRVGRDSYATAFRDSMQPRELSQMLDQEYSDGVVSALISSECVLVADVDAEVVGFAVIAQSDHEMARWAPWELRKLYAHPKCQNQGVGAALIEASLSARANSDLVLDVWKENLGARRLYERFGFSHVGARANPNPGISNSDPDLVMVRGCSLTGSGKSPAA